MRGIALLKNIDRVPIDDSIDRSQFHRDVAGAMVSLPCAEASHAANAPLTVSENLQETVSTLGSKHRTGCYTGDTCL